MRSPLTIALLTMLAVFGVSGARSAEAHEAAFSFVFPQDAISTEFTSSFGDGRSGGRSHHGTDLMAPKMTPVFAIVDGVVTIMGSGGSAGEWIAIEHADGWESWYMHLNNDNLGTDDGAADPSLTYAPGIVEGAEVVSGRLLGWSGDSGNAESSSPHTHFELHHDGGVVDPYPYLVSAYDLAYLAIPIERLIGLVSADLVGAVR